MERIKFFLMMVLVSVLCCACGNTESNQGKEMSSTEAVQAVIPESASEIITDFSLM